MAIEVTSLEVEELTPEEGREILDNAARRELNLSADEFERRWAAGEFADSEDPRVTRVAMLLQGAW